MKVVLIVAAAINNVIGKDNDMLWSIGPDFKRFKELTMGHPMIMGRKTFESLPGMLPGREHIVLTRNHSEFIKQFRSSGIPEDLGTCNSLETALSYCEALNNETVYVIGGGEIYREAMKYADTIELTRVHLEPDGDTTFPEIEWKDFGATPASEILLGKDRVTGKDVQYQFITYKRHE